MPTIKIQSLATAQSQIDAAQPGDAVEFAAGLTGNLSVDPMDSVTYIGNGAKLTGIAGRAVFYGSSMHDASFSGFSFIGNAFGFSNMRNVTITKNVFTFIGAGTAIYLWTSAPPDSSKGNPAAWNASLIPAATNVQITDNDFVGTPNYVAQCEAIHVRLDTLAPPGPDNGPGKSTGFVFARNRMRHISRCGLELQGGGTSNLIEDNLFDQPTLSTTRSVNDGSMAFSCAADASVGMIIRRNVAKGEGRKADGVGVRNGYECAGHGVQVYDNYCDQMNNAFILQSPRDGQIHDNQYIDCLSGAVSAGPLAPGGSITNNGPAVKLSFDPSRPWPLSPTGAPVPTPTPTAPAVWTAKDGHALLNGTPDAATHDVASVFEYPVGSGKWFQATISGDVWSLPGAGAIKGDPRPPVVPTPTPVTIDIGHRVNGGQWVVDATIKP